MTGRDMTGRKANGRGGAGSGRVLTDAMWDRITLLIGRVDAVAHAMEVKWGVGRLQFLVAQEWGERFLSQKRKFHNAVHHGSPADVEIEAERMITAWTYLDRLATEGGKATMQGLPVAVSEWVGPDGVVWMVVSGAKEAHWLAKWLEGQGDPRKRQVWSVEEISRLAGHIPEIGTVSKLKEVFGQAIVESVRMPVTEGIANFINDEIPF